MGVLFTIWMNCDSFWTIRAGWLTMPVGPKPLMEETTVGALSQDSVHVHDLDSRVPSSTSPA